MGRWSPHSLVPMLVIQKASSLQSSSKHQPQQLANGFTMIELLVFLGIIATFLVFVLGIILSIFRSRDVSGQRELVRRSVTDTLAELSQTVRTSTVASIEENEGITYLIIDGVEGEEIAYYVQDQQLFKEDQALVTAGVKVTEFQVERVNPTATVPLLKVALTMESVQIPDIKAYQETYVSLRYVKQFHEP